MNYDGEEARGLAPAENRNANTAVDTWSLLERQEKDCHQKDGGSSESCLQMRNTRW